MPRTISLLGALLVALSPVFSQQIAVVQPNGGESIDGCAPYTIQWTASGTSGEFNIDYSTDGGQTWVSLASFLTNTNSFSWEAPNIYSNGCLIRVYDAQAPEVADESNSTFSLSAPIQFLYPDGGQTLYAGQTVQVGWMSAYYLDAVGLQLSLDDGLSWTSVASNLTGGLYEWTVPNSPSANARLRVGTDFSSCFVDGSDAPFAIVSEVTVNEPNGGEAVLASVVPPSYAGFYLMNNGTIVTDGGRFFDSGGPDADASNEDFTKYFWPATQNNELRMTFTRLELYNGYSSYDDRLYVYDATTNQLLLSLQGTPSEQSLQTNPPIAQGRGLKIVYQNETGYGGTAAGWDANIESIDVTYTGTTYPLNWDVAGTSKEFHLDYSTNGGLTWKRIMSNYYSPAGHYDWPAPNDATVEALVKVTDTENSAVVDVSDAVFTIEPAAARVTAPNGGEAWFSGVSHEVNWVADFFQTPSVSIAYSTDSGQTWTEITTTLNDGSYDWTLPSDPSTTALLQVAETSADPASDTSDVDFTILPHITVTSPNGEEELDGCAATSIQWSAGGTSGTYGIDLSMDGGETWTTLTESASGSSWNWSVITNETSAQARIRVRDAADGTKSDFSDADFDLIKTEDVVMLSPNGGETWFTGQVKQINYIKSAAANNVNLQYSTDAGASWTTIASSQNGGAYSWEVPNTPSNEALVRVQDQSVSCRVDDSDEPFTIVSDINITDPNGGETLTATVVPPTFGGYYIMDNGTITTDGGRFFDSGGPDANASNEDYTKYFWPATQNNELRLTFTHLDLYNGYSSYDDRLYVYDATTNQLLLSLQGTPSEQSLQTNPPTAQGRGLKIVYQNETGYGGTASGWDANLESIDVTYENTTHPLDWDVAGTSKEFNLEYSTDGGLTWKRIMSHYYSPAGHYDWPVPNNATEQALVKVTDTENGEVVDVSDATFAIGEAATRLTQPNGQEQWFAGTTHEIQWVQQFIPASVVTLEYSLDGGIEWTAIATTDNDGTYEWTLPSTASTTARVRVSNLGHSDTSDADFTILPHITVTSPNGEEELDGCAATTIQWSAGGTSGTYGIDLSMDGGSTWTTLTESASGSSWNWSVITNETSAQARIRVRDAADGTKSDFSDADFDLIKTEDVVMLSPNGGETWFTGQVKQINYIKSAAANNVNLQYSTDAGSTWTTIASSQNGGAYSWEVPNTPSNEALVRVQDQSVSCRVDDSDELFTIVSDINITDPNGGETLMATVVPPTFGGYYIMDNGTITTDGGRFFDSGGPDANASNEDYTKYFWPATQNNELRLTFTHLDLYNGYSSYDDRLYVYDATTNQLLLSLQGTPSEQSLQTNPPTAQGRGLKIVYQNETGYGGTASGWDANLESIDVTYDNTTYPLDWDVAGTSKEFNLEYSTDGGLTWKRIMSHYYSPTGHYDWPVPNNATEQALVKVTDTENGEVVDVSDATFAIAEAATRLTQPNGQEQWFAGTTHEIQWVQQFIPASVVTLEYSLDGGIEWTAIATTDNDGTHEWTLPSTASTTARVRVSNLGHSDTSDADFTIHPHITVTSPNGGETRDGCAATNITWAAGGTSGTYGIDLSMDGGETWTNLTESASGSSWNWSVITNENSTQARIRVRDAGDETKTDMSDADFTLVKTEDVVLLSPNGGETWATGEVRQLNYLKNAGVGSVDLAYSLDDGSNWTSIASSQTDGAYAWQIPNDPGLALVRVQDANVACRNDLSDESFTIVSEVVITEPNGGEQYQATVMPAAFGGIYLMDNGSVTTDGGRFYDSGGPQGNASNTDYTKYFWPATQDNELRMTFTRLELYNGYSSYDDRLYVYDATTNQLLLNLQGSPSAQSLQTNPPTAQGQGLKIVYQNETGYGGTAAGWDANLESIDVENAGTTHPMDWDVAGTSKEFNLDYTTNGGLTWTRIMSNYYSPTGHYDWPVPNAPSAACKVRVTDTENGAVVDESDFVYQILPGTPAITVEHPNSATTVHIGSVEEVTWQSSFLSTAYVALDYSTDNGATWTVITASTLNDGLYEWLVPATESTLALIRVRDAANNEIQDVSDIGFTIAPPIALQTQNTLGADYRSCTFTNIDWFAGGTSGTYAISYSTDGGVTWVVIESAYTNSAAFISYNWLIPNTPSTQALVKVEDVSAPSKVDISDNTFTISPTVELTSFTYGGVATAGSTVEITWNDTLTSNFWDLAYSIDGGSNWTNIANNHYTLDGSYSWAVPFAASSFAAVKVQDANNVCKSAESVLAFDLTAYAPTIDIVSPNGGESFSGCSTVTLEWTDSSPNDAYNLEYRPTPGSPWISIASNVVAPDRTYEWTLPNEPMPQATVRVRDVANSNNYDVSDWHFVTTAGVDVALASSTGAFTACGALTLQASGADAYTWSTGAGGDALEVTNSGSYTVTGTTGSCTGTATALVTISTPPAQPTILIEGPSVICEGEAVSMSVEAGTGTVYWPELGIGSPSVVVTSGGTFHASLTVAGCTSLSEPVTIEVLPVPALTGLTTNSPVAVGQNLELSVVAPAGAEVGWNGPAGFGASTASVTLAPATLDMAGVYAVSASAQGCVSDTLFAIVEITNSPVLGGSLTGLVTTPQGLPVAGVTVSAESAASGAAITASTDENGGYGVDLASGGSYWISAAKATDDPADNGITTLDILLAQSHVLGLNGLDSPWALLAADANGSGTITTLDLLLMQQVILQMASTFPGVDDWTLVPADVEFADPEDPFDFFAESLIATLSEGVTADFTAVKRGDVNGSWAPLGGMPWNEMPLPLDVHATWWSETEVSLAISTATTEALRGLQFTLGWPATWTLAGHSIATENMKTNSDFHLNQRFPFQFASPDGSARTFEATEPFLTLHFQVPAGAEPAAGLAMVSDLVPSEACESDLTVVLPELAGSSVGIGSAPELSELSVAPNPTRAGFTLTGPFSTAAEVRAFDARGREISLAGCMTGEGTFRAEGLQEAGWYTVTVVEADRVLRTRILVMR